MARVTYDAEARKWFERHPFVETTVIQCTMCGLAYKPELGHKCKQKAEKFLREGDVFCADHVSENSKGEPVYFIRHVGALIGIAAARCEVMEQPAEVQIAEDRRPT